MLGATVLSDDDMYCAIAVQRRRRFDEPSIALHRRLAPHLTRAVQLNTRLSALDSRCTAAVDALDRLRQAAIVVDAEARALFANKKAERLVGPFGCLRMTAGVLHARSYAETAKLKALIAGCAAPPESDCGGAIGLPCEGRALTMSALVLPLRGESPAFFLSPRAVAIVFVTDPTWTPARLDAQLRRRFGLAPAEAAFALQIAKGDGLGFGRQARDLAVDRLHASCACLREDRRAAASRPRAPAGVDDVRSDVIAAYR